MRKSLKSLLLLIPLLLGTGAEANYQPKVLERRDLNMEINPLVLPLFVNMKEASNKAQQAWLLDITRSASMAAGPLGVSREQDELIRQHHQKMAALIPSLYPLENKDALREQLTRGFYGSTERSSKPFFAQNVAADQWICVVHSAGLCEILQFSMRGNKIVRTNVIHRPRAHFTAASIKDSGVFSPTSPVFNGYYPGDLLQFDGSIFGMEFDTQGTSWLLPKSVFLEDIRNVKKIDTAFTVIENANDSFGIRMGKVDASELTKTFDPRLNDARPLARKGFNDQRARLIANASTFENAEQRDVLSQLVTQISLLLQTPGQSRALDEARALAHKSLSTRIPSLMGPTEKRPGPGSMPAQGVSEQILRPHVVLGLPYFETDEAARNWLCIINMRSVDRKQCDIIFFDAALARLYMTTVVLTDRSGAAQGRGLAAPGSGMTFDSFYPGDVVRFDGSFFGLGFGPLSRANAIYYPRFIYFSQLDNLRLVKMPFRLTRLDDYNFDISSK